MRISYIFKAWPDAQALKESSKEELALLIFLYENGEGSEALTQADIGADCFVCDDQTVGKIGGTNKVKAGVVLDVTPEGVAVIV